MGTLPSKTIVLIGGSATEAEVTTWAETFWRDGLSQTQGVAGFAISTAWVPGTYRAMVEIWGNGGEALGAAAQGRGWRLRAFAVQERVEKHTAPAAAAGVVPGLRQIAIWKRRPQMTRMEARGAWDEHVPLALKIHLGAAGYVRNWIVSPGPDDPDGIACLAYPTDADFAHRRYVNEEGRAAIAADVGRFIGDVDVMLARQTVFLAPTGRASEASPSAWAGPA